MTKQLEFTINMDTGEMTLDINGEVGPSCDNVQKIVEQATGAPRSVTKKPSYYQQVRPTGQVKR